MSLSLLLIIYLVGVVFNLLIMLYLNEKKEMCISLFFAIISWLSLVVIIYLIAESISVSAYNRIINIF